MISPKWAILVAAFALVGVVSLPGTAFAQDDESQNAETEIERNNSIEQSIEQSQEACTNEAEVETSDDDEVDIGGDNSVDVEQVNECTVEQSQTAENAAAIEDNSVNDISVDQILARLNLF
jgi:hypothetical protein